MIKILIDSRRFKKLIFKRIQLKFISSHRFSIIWAHCLNQRYNLSASFIYDHQLIYKQIFFETSSKLLRNLKLSSKPQKVIPKKILYEKSFCSFWSLRSFRNLKSKWTTERETKVTKISLLNKSLSKWLLTRKFQILESGDVKRWFRSLSCTGTGIAIYQTVAMLATWKSWFRNPESECIFRLGFALPSFLSYKVFATNLVKHLRLILCLKRFVKYRLVSYVNHLIKLLE